MTQATTHSDREATGQHALPNPEEQPTVPLWPTAGRACGLQKSATYAAAARGEIPTIRLGGKLVSPTAALRRLLQLDVEVGV